MADRGEASPCGAKSERWPPRSMNSAIAASMSSGGPQSPARHPRAAAAAGHQQAQTSARRGLPGCRGLGKGCSTLSSTRKHRPFADPGGLRADRSASHGCRGPRQRPAPRGPSRTAARSMNQTPCERSGFGRDRESQAGLAAAAGSGQGDDALSRRASRTSAISSDLPTRLVTSPGRFVGTSVVRSGRASSAAPGTTSR
jgi:hypothetical protein